MFIIKNCKSNLLLELDDNIISCIWNTINHSAKNGTLLNLASILTECGIGVSKDISNAIKYYKMAIELGNSNAMNNLAYLYSHDVEYNDISEAIKYYKMAIEFKNDVAIYNLAYIYHTNTEYKNILEAIKYYKIAIELKNPMAINNLACIYDHDDEYKNISDAVKYYQMAIELKNSNAMYNFAHICANNEKYKNISFANKYYKLFIEPVCNMNVKPNDRLFWKHLTEVIEQLNYYNSIDDERECPIADTICKIVSNFDRCEKLGYEELEYIFKLYHKLKILISENSVYKRKIVSLIFHRIRMNIQVDETVLIALLTKYDTILALRNKFKLIIMTSLITNSQNEKSCIFGIDNNIIHNIIYLL